MDESLLIFVIPGLFLAICLTFITVSHLYYRSKAKENGKMTAKVSIVNISNIANNMPPSPTLSRKSRKRSKSPGRGNKGKKVLNGLPKLEPNFCTNSSVIYLNENDSPPSYQSLFETHPNVQNEYGNSQNISNNWLHPNSAYATTLESHTSNQYAVLYL